MQGAIVSDTASATGVSLRTKCLGALHVGPPDGGLLADIEVTAHALYPLNPPLIRITAIRRTAGTRVAPVLTQAQLAVLEGELNVVAVDLAPSDPLPTQLAYLSQCVGALADALRSEPLASSEPLQYLAAQLTVQGRARLHSVQLSAALPI